MITKFKVFEENNELVFVEYWKVPTNKEKLIIALNKIEDCKLEREDFYSDNNKPKFGNRKFAYVIKLTRSVIHDTGYSSKVNFYWFYSKDIRHIKTYENEFMGEIKVSKQEVKDYKIEKDMEKYNL